MRTWWLLLGLVVAAWGCVESSSVQCGDILCPENTECRALTAPDEQICATKTQIEQCMGHVEADTCDAGWCHDGVCLPIVCGNNRVDHSEVCDDGNTVTGDGTCSGDCASDETCGNGVVDPLKLGMMGDKEPNEQCDDANFVSGDGCSSRCLRETMRWQQLDPNPPPAMLGVSMTYDATRRRTVMFGGRQVINGKDVSSGQTFEWNGVGWAHIPTTTAPTPRLLAGLYYDPVLRRTVLFGGMTGDDNDPAFTDMWQWDGRDWTLVPAPAVLPPRRSRFGLAYDGKRKVAVLFGGFDINGPRSDTWEWDGTTWKENTSATHPPAQYSHVFVYDPKRGVIVMAGGSNTTKETWEYDGAWHKITTATTPDDLARSAATYSPQLGKVIAAGGFSSTSGQSSTTYAYDGTTWTDLAPQGLSSPREEVAMCADPNTSIIVMYGGQNTQPLDEVWTYTPMRNTWSLVRAQAAPPPLFGASATYDPATATAYMFGGVSPSGTDSAELWTYDGVVWTSFIGAGPVGRKFPGLAYDIDHHRLVMFGGSAGPGTSGSPVAPETWFFSNGWTNANLTGPGQRSFHAMTYDTKRRHVVLYGGVDSTLLDDTWELDNTTWTPKGNAGPGPRAGAGSTFDLSTSSLVVVNGQNMSGGPFSDAWSYESGWTQVTAQTPFEARFIPGLASDGARGSVVMFGGGSAGGGVFDDLWELRGTTWTRIDAGAHPSGRAGHVVFPARNGDGIIVFGGSGRLEDATGALNDVWQLESTSASPREICTDAKLDNDGDGLAGCADPDCWASCSPLCPPGTSCSDPSAPKCGDGQCNPFLETCRLCPDDCGACTAVCGDAYCDPGETAAACPGDCP